MIFDKKEFPKQLLYILVSLIVGMLLFSVVISHYSKASNEPINLNIVDNIELFVWGLSFSFGAIGKYAGYLGVVLYFSFWVKWGWKIYLHFNKK
ncbi:hypothetical protein K5X82_07205 [Halosquirtibacter xylanolyticus]|uniref:hypothetical protein n=1 Tax=Halosquirtibacter xylanolyticus TaxID=3374599 RepID=UPI003748D397|nr:hypothetical protein K5X82_07205 [Prolixibacteraceae bacterium]